MNKYIGIIIAIILIIAGIIGFIFFNSNKQTNTGNRFSTQKLSSKSSEKKTEISKQTIQPKEEEISSFTTTIKSQSDQNRLTNISITCNTLNGTIVEPRTNFFFL